MLTALALAAVLGGTPAQPAGDLKLTNVRLTVGELGPPREGAKLLPGDVLFIAYDIEGLPINNEGVTRYQMEMDVQNATGQSVFKQAPRELTDFVPLRGNRMPARAYITLGLDQAPGTYTCKVKVTEPKSKAVGQLEVKFEVLKREFAVVAVYTSHDPKGEISAPTAGQVGQTLYVQFSVASFERDPKTKQPNVEMEFQLFDDKGLPTLGTPLKDVQDNVSPQQVKDGDGAFAKQFPLFLNRPGKFVVQMKATDRVTKKESTYRLPVTVAPAN